MKAANPKQSKGVAVRAEPPARDNPKSRSTGGTDESAILRFSPRRATVITANTGTRRESRSSTVTRSIT